MLCIRVISGSSPKSEASYLEFVHGIDNSAMNEAPSKVDNSAMNEAPNGLFHIIMDFVSLTLKLVRFNP